jgi:hypothetical protein
MSRDILLRRALELVGQMQATLKQSAETTRQFQENLKAQEEKNSKQMQDTMTASVENTRQFGRHLHSLLEIVPDIEKNEAVHKHLQNAEPTPTLLETFNNSPQSGFLQDVVDDSITATKFKPMDEPSVPVLTEPNVAVQLWRDDSRAMNEPLLSKINPLDAQPVTEVMKQNVEKPFPPLVVFDNNKQLSLADRSVELQLVDDDENAAANNSVGAVDGTHREPRVFSSCGCYVSLHKDEEATSLDAPSCTNDCYVAVDYIRHLNNYTYVAFADAKVHFLKFGPALFHEWPRLLETQRPAPSQLWRYLVLQHSTKTAKHRWRWKLPGWRTSWVPITGDTDLRHLSWKRTEPNAQISGMKREGVELSVLLAETQRREAVAPYRVPDWRELIPFSGLAVSAVWETLFCVNTPKPNPTPLPLDCSHLWTSGAVLDVNFG